MRLYVFVCVCVCVRICIGAFYTSCIDVLPKPPAGTGAHASSSSLDSSCIITTMYINIQFVFFFFPDSLVYMLLIVHA